MSRRLLLFNVALGLVAALLAAALTRELLATQPLPASPAPRAARPAPATAAAATAAALPSAAAYGVIAAKNLFSPSRSEAPPGPVVAAGPRPVLHGVVMDGVKSRAYLEDPAIKRTFSYAVGDTVSGGRVDSISADRVVIARGDGLVEVLLRDPSKPKPAASPVAGAAPAGLAPPGPTSAAAPDTPAPGAPPARSLAPAARPAPR